MFLVKQRTIVIQGNPVDGLTFIGPFPTGEDALTYAAKELSDSNPWWVTTLEPPQWKR